MSSLEARILAFMRRSDNGLVAERTIAEGLDLGDPLDVVAGLGLLEVNGFVQKCYVRERPSGYLRELGWLLTRQGLGDRQAAPGRAGT